MNGEDVFSLKLIGQVYKKEFIVSSFANQFGRQDADIVTGCGHEYRRFTILHPGKKCREDARRNTGVH